VKRILVFASLSGAASFNHEAAAQSVLRRDVKLEAQFAQEEPVYRLTSLWGYEDQLSEGWSVNFRSDCFTQSRGREAGANLLWGEDDASIACLLLESSVKYQTFSAGMEVGRFEDVAGQSELTRPSHPGRVNVLSPQSPFALRQGFDQVQGELLLGENGVIQAALVYQSDARADEATRWVPLVKSQYLLHEWQLGLSFTESFLGHRASYAWNDQLLFYVDGAYQSLDPAVSEWKHLWLAGSSLTLPELGLDSTFEYYRNAAGLSRGQALAELDRIENGRRPLVLGQRAERQFPMAPRDRGGVWQGSDFLSQNYFYVRLRWPELQSLLLTRLHNLDDGSAVETASISWNLESGQTILLETQHFSGSMPTEFGFYGTRSTRASMRLGLLANF
jgi:hypothetical protein